MVSLIIPCYKPPDGWPDNLRKAVGACMAAISEELEVVLVIDGSPDDLQMEAMDKLSAAPSYFQLIQYADNRGKGYAIRQGVKAARGRIIIYTDIDFPYTIESFKKIYTALTKDSYDIAVGVKDDYYYSKVPPVRKFVSRTLRALIRISLAMPISDTQCGLKGFTAQMKPIFLNTEIDRYLFDLEFIRAAYRSSLQPNIVAIPIRLREGIVFRSMNPRILASEALNFIRVILKKR